MSYQQEPNDTYEYINTGFYLNTKVKLGQEPINQLTE